MLFYRCNGSGRGLLSPHPRQLRYDNVSGLIVDGCRLAHALLGKQDVYDHARLGERLNLVGMLDHNIVERERLTIRELSGHLLGKRLVELSRLRQCLGLGGVFLEHVELVRDLTVEVLDCMDVCLIVIAHDLTDKVVGYALGAALCKDGEHLVVGELELGASGSHELTPIRPRDASEPPFGSFFSVPFGQPLLYYCIDFLARTILKNMEESWKPQVDGLVFSDSQNIGTVAR